MLPENSNLTLVCVSASYIQSQLPDKGCRFKIGQWSGEHQPLPPIGFVLFELEFFIKVYLIQICSLLGPLVQLRAAFKGSAKDLLWPLIPPRLISPSSRLQAVLRMQRLVKWVGMSPQCTILPQWAYCKHYRSSQNVEMLVPWWTMMHFLFS